MSAKVQVDDHLLADALLGERIRLVARRGFVASLSTPVAAALLLYLSHAEHLADLQPLYVWSVLITLIVILNLACCLPQALTEAQPANKQLWVRLQLGAKALLGLGWGASVWFLIPIATPIFGMMLYIILSGICAMVVLVHSMFWTSVVAFLLGIYLPILLYAVFHPQPLDVYVAMAGALYALLLIVYSGVVNRQLVRGVGAALQARLLAEELLDANMRAEQSLAALQEEHCRLQLALGTIRSMAHQDELTQLPNRRAAIAALNDNLAKWESGQVICSLIMLDIDFFKAINDTYGHDIGDDVLVAMARRLDARLRPADLLARFGGEEFIILLPGMRLDDAAQLARRLCEQLAAEPLLQQPVCLPVTASFGITQLRHGDTLHDWLRRADQAMYASKRMGRNQCSALQ
ncbi:diguanylate cyclase [Vogesella sp. DC21W]|uniref:diguanylate cyclase n=1 Tax=Vogesella aquatica TaxID=2984206 RepID=A0ABT5IUW9_9NEIS|nr:diguanylate cyclase [Vogesella aquatica]MDC7716362.1 diguanylate cyclase [Vogesella aquatica]